MYAVIVMYVQQLLLLCFSIVGKLKDTCFLIVLQVNVCSPALQPELSFTLTFAIMCDIVVYVHVNTYERAYSCTLLYYFFMLLFLRYFVAFY